MIVKGCELNDEIVAEIAKFTILWNWFEDEKCGCNCNGTSLEAASKRITPNITMEQLATCINQKLHNSRISIETYVENILHPQNAIKKPKQCIKMKQFLEHSSNNEVYGCLLLIFRIRNNLFHGLKELHTLNYQVELFRSINRVLESIS